MNTKMTPGEIRWVEMGGSRAARVRSGFGRSPVAALGEGASEAEFRHEALVYSTEEEFVAGTTAFIRDGLDRGEAVLAVVDARKIDWIRAALSSDAGRVEFADMNKVGSNPALIIQAWRDFASANRGVSNGLRGVGEPVYPERSEAALVECQIHEALLNVAFRGEPNFWLLCPYETSLLAEPVVERAMGSHPFVRDHSGTCLHAAHEIDDDIVELTRPLPAPRGSVETIPFDATSLHLLRRRAAARGAESGVSPDRVDDLVVAISEIATNAIMHGESGGRACFWVEDDCFLCDVHGSGHIRDPLVGRLRPAPGQVNGYGVWLANQFCDLVQIRSNEWGTTVRLHVRRV